MFFFFLTAISSRVKRFCPDVSGLRTNVPCGIHFDFFQIKKEKFTGLVPQPPGLISGDIEVFREKLC